MSTSPHKKLPEPLAQDESNLSIHQGLDQFKSWAASIKNATEHSVQNNGSTKAEFANLCPLILCGPQNSPHEHWPKELSNSEGAEYIEFSLREFSALKTFPSAQHPYVSICDWVMYRLQKRLSKLNHPQKMVVWLHDLDRVSFEQQESLLPLCKLNFVQKDADVCGDKNHKTPIIFLIFSARASYRLSDGWTKSAHIVEVWQGLVNCEKLATHHDGVCALALTATGVELVPIQVAIYKGKPACIATSNLSKSLEEQAQIAYSVLRKSANRFGLSDELLSELTIHVHLGTGNIHKQGSSAGLAIFIAMYRELLRSVLKSAVEEKTIAACGELDLEGNIHAVDGVAEKMWAAVNCGIEEFYYPTKAVFPKHFEVPKVLIAKSVKTVEALALP